jgi:DNA modification methylase
VDTEGKILEVRLTANWMRRNMKREEITRLLTELCEIHEEEWDGHYSRRIADITGFDIDTVEKYLPAMYKQQRSIPPLDFSKGKEYVKWWLLKYGREELPQWFKKLPMPSDDDRGFARYHSNVWEASPERPKGYGDAAYHGNTSPEVAREILVRYSNEGELVLDNMVGSGTILDMCGKLRRECLSYDISPSRSEILKADARNLALPDNHVDFAFSHFPYGDMVGYSGLDGDLSIMAQEKFLEESRKVMLEVHRVLKPGRFYAVLIGDQRKDKQVIDWSAEFSRMGRELFTLHDKIIWYAKGQTAYRGNDRLDLQAAEHNFCKPTFDTLLVFKK